MLLLEAPFSPHLTGQVSSGVCQTFKREFFVLGCFVLFSVFNIEFLIENTHLHFLFVIKESKRLITKGNCYMY